MSRRYLIPTNLFYRENDPLPPDFPVPNTGDIYFNTVSNTLRVFYDDAWRDMRVQIDTGDPDNPAVPIYQLESTDGTIVISDPGTGIVDITVDASAHFHDVERSGRWTYASQTTMADPGSGRIRSNASPATQIAISSTSNQGGDASVVLAGLTTDDIITFQEYANAMNWARYALTAPPTNNGTWFLLDVELADSDTDGTEVPKNADIAVSIGGGGGGGGVKVHGELEQLDQDDHPQYLNVTRGDARYYTQAQVDDTTVSVTGDTMTGDLVFNDGLGTSSTIHADGQAYFHGIAVRDTLKTYIANDDDIDFVALSNVVGYHDRSSSVTGAIVFKMGGPHYAGAVTAYPQMVLEFQGSIYSGAALTPYTLRVKGYLHATSGWLQTGVEYVGTQTPVFTRVRMAKGISDDRQAFVILGDIDTEWAYPQIALVQALIGQHTSTRDLYESGWDAFLTTDLSDYTIRADHSISGSDDTYVFKSGDTMSGNLTVQTPVAPAVILDGANGQANYFLYDNGLAQYHFGLISGRARIYGQDRGSGYLEAYSFYPDNRIFQRGHQDFTQADSVTMPDVATNNLVVDGDIVIGQNKRLILDDPDNEAVIVAGYGDPNTTPPVESVAGMSALYLDTSSGNLWIMEIPGDESAWAQVGTSTHNHAGIYAPAGHEHGTVYAPIAHVPVADGGSGDRLHVQYPSLPPANLGLNAAIGVSDTIARADHVHKRPTVGEIGAATWDHDHDEFTHDHDGFYAPYTHISGGDHDARYYTKSTTDSLLSGKAATSHVHSGADITSGTVAYARLPVGTGAAQVAQGSHGHAYSPTSHDHDLDYAPLSHPHSQYAQVTHGHDDFDDFVRYTDSGVEYPPIVGGKIPQEYIPPAPPNATYFVANEAERLALTGLAIGDVAVQESDGSSWAFKGPLGGESNAANWVAQSTGSVVSVNGQTGVVDLDAVDVDALPITGGTVTGDLFVSGSRLSKKHNSGAVQWDYYTFDGAWRFRVGGSGAEASAPIGFYHGDNPTFLARNTEIDTIGKPIQIGDPKDDDSAVARRWVLSRGGDNLITNGTGYMQSNYNWVASGMQYQPDEAPPGAVGSFTAQFPGIARTVVSDELVPVVASEAYELSFAIKQLSAISAADPDLSCCYLGHACYDVEKNPVHPYNYQFRAGSTTTLAQDLNDGDDYIYLTDNIENWYDPAGASVHYATVAFWNYVDGNGRLWPPETYTRWYYPSIYANLDIPNNRLVLHAPWSGGSWSAGHPLSNTQSGGTYNYSAASGRHVGSDWQYYRAVISGQGFDSAEFRPGTAFIKPLMLLDRSRVSGYGGASWNDDNSIHCVSGIGLRQIPATHDHDEDYLSLTGGSLSGNLDVTGKITTTDQVVVGNTLDVMNGAETGFRFTNYGGDDPVIVPGDGASGWNTTREIRFENFNDRWYLEGNTVIGGAVISDHATPVFELFDSNAPTNQKRTQIKSNDGSLSFQGLNDAGSGSDDLVEFVRTASSNGFERADFRDNGVARVVLGMHDRSGIYTMDDFGAGGIPRSTDPSNYATKPGMFWIREDDDSGGFTDSGFDGGDFSSVSHLHTGVYSPVDHTHSGDFAPTNHSHPHSHIGEYADPTHKHDDDYAETGHTHDYAPTGHDHDTDYSELGHTHEVAPAAFLGEIRMFASVSLLPADWLQCNGSAIPAQYTALIAVIGATTPDMTDRVPMGGGTVLASGGIDTLAIANLPSHAHSANHNHSASTGSAGDHDHVLWYSSTAGGNYSDLVRGRNSDRVGNNRQANDSDGSHTHSVTVNTTTMNTGSTGSGTAFQPKHVRFVFAIYAGEAQ